MVSNKVLEVMKETDKIMYDYPHLKYYEAFELAKILEGSGYRSG